VRKLLTRIKWRERVLHAGAVEIRLERAQERDARGGRREEPNADRPLARRSRSAPSKP
jgi:hypothetical protein